MFKKKKGFTLAEVMVALTLIGVISVLTVPSLMTNTNLKKKAMAYKKAQLTLNDAFVNGNTDGSATKDLKNLVEKLTPHMGVKYYSSNGTNVTNAHGAVAGQEKSSNWIITNDGIGYKYTQIVKDDSCSNKIVDINTQATSKDTRATACYEVMVDVDGPKKGENAFATVTTASGKVTAITGDRFYIYVGSDGIATGNPTATGTPSFIEGAKILDAED